MIHPVVDRTYFANLPRIALVSVFGVILQWLWAGKFMVT